MAKFKLIILLSVLLSGCAMQQQSPLVYRTALPDSMTPAEYIEKIDFYREALLDGLSSKQVYRSNRDFLEETLAERGVTPETFQYLSGLTDEKKKEREAAAAKKNDIKAPRNNDSAGKLTQYNAVLTEMAKVRNQYDQICSTLQQREMELMIVQMEVDRNPRDREYRAAANNQEAMTREWMDKTIEEELSPLHKRIFELDASLSRKKQDFAK